MFPFYFTIAPFAVVTQVALSTLLDQHEYTLHHAHSLTLLLFCCPIAFFGLLGSDNVQTQSLFCFVYLLLNGMFNIQLHPSSLSETKKLVTSLVICYEVFDSKEHTLLVHRLIYVRCLYLAINWVTGILDSINDQVASIFWICAKNMQYLAYLTIPLFDVETTGCFRWYVIVLYILYPSYVFRLDSEYVTGEFFSNKGAIATLF